MSGANLYLGLGYRELDHSDLYILSFFSDDTTPINHASDSIDTIWSNLVKDRHAEYCEYIEKKSYSYDNFDNVCTKEESNCSHFYNKYKEHNPNTVFKTLKCPENIKTARFAAPEASSMDHSLKQELGAPYGSHGMKLATETSQMVTKFGAFYTPLCTYIRKLGVYHQSRMSNVDAVVDEFLSRSQESGDILFGSTGNYILCQHM
ncbi:PIR Superfamily Protein [Plasmodium ovale wallikeri]|uniref:PIR Superfamily Protein n=1 Tax=Plasmodium ovale wallikeri TaxID=864142 RepID=A0A1A9AJ34_PLAOA|nr:PIR Superfamily Protein [Plasmodium ovale wallikeri]SBT58798.1 PIR Superfamily Protein [Plasmodium ovale wallikeri]